MALQSPDTFGDCDDLYTTATTISRFPSRGNATNCSARSSSPARRKMCDGSVQEITAIWCVADPCPSPLINRTHILQYPVFKEAVEAKLESFNYRDVYVHVGALLSDSELQGFDPGGPLTTHTQEVGIVADGIPC